MSRFTETPREPLNEIEQLRDRADTAERIAADNFNQLMSIRETTIEECAEAWFDTLAEWANAEGISFDAANRLMRALEQAIRALKGRA